jgi:hypothetical protein
LIASSGSLLAVSGVLAAVDVPAFTMAAAGVAFSVACELESLSQAAKDVASSTAHNIFFMFLVFLVGRRSDAIRLAPLRIVSLLPCRMALWSLLILR